MGDNNLLMIILAFVVGFMLQGMMKNMCGGRLLEGSVSGEAQLLMAAEAQRQAAEAAEAQRLAAAEVSNCIQTCKNTFISSINGRRDGPFRSCVMNCLRDHIS